MKIVISATRLRAAVIALACLGSACAEDDPDPRYGAHDASVSTPMGDAGSSSPTGDDAGSASPSLDGGVASDASALPADGSASTPDAAQDAAISVPKCEGAAPSADGGAGCFACTHQGWVEGVVENGTCQYLGVPYAKPPVGPLRFAPPEPAASWSGVRKATEFGAACVQALDLSLSDVKSEDCLFVNVWTPSAAPAGKLPVMVFIHGGGYSGGATNTYSGVGLTRKGPVVVVSMNYRLGALGFFAHPDLDKTRANAPSGSDGIRDQQLALRWVRDNIASFHGDPNNVTVFGESAGSSSVCVHVVSPGSRDLARRFVLESGVCTRGVANGIEAVRRETMYDFTRRMVSDLCPDAGDAIACLRGLPADDVIFWAPADGGGGAPMGGISWVPVIEGAGGVLPDSPDVLLERGDFHRGEIIVGTNKNEYGLFQLIPSIFSTEQLREQVQAQFGARTDEIMPLYASIASSDPNQAYVTLMTDIMFRCPARSFARRASARGSRVYLYSFEEGSAWHADEMNYVFGDGYYALTLISPVQALADAMQGYWTSFAADGDPNAQGLPAWPAYQADSDQHMTLVNPPAPGSALQRSACDFWDGYLTSP